MYFLYKLSIICIYYMCDGRHFFLSTITGFSWYNFLYNAEPVGETVVDYLKTLYIVNQSFHIEN